MDALLAEAFTHNAWATKRLLSFCRDLTPEQLNAPGIGTYGSILATFNHLIRSDAGYLPRLKIARPAWTDEDDDVVIADLDALEARVDETAALWQEYLADPLDAERLLLLDEGTYECRSSVPIVQALHHGNSHREQICALITGFGLQPPDVQAWAFADETGRARFLPAAR